MSRSFLAPILLPLDPVANLEAATKQYVDNRAGASANWPYRWSTTTTAADPGHGFVRANNANPNLATALYVSAYDRNDTGHPVLFTLGVNDRIGLYLAGDLTRWITFTVTGAVTNNASSWITVPVAKRDGGPNGFAPGNNVDLLLGTSGGASTDSGWLLLALGSGWSNFQTDAPGNYSPLRYRKLNGVTYLEGTVVNSAGAAQPMATLPAGYRPNRWLITWVYGDAVQRADLGRMDIGGDGTLTFPFLPVCAYIGITATFPADQ